jgi:hypothetical protein
MNQLKIPVGFSFTLAVAPYFSLLDTVRSVGTELVSELFLLAGVVGASDEDIV